MMITRQKKVPWLWVCLTMLPWAFIIFVACAFMQTMTFQLRKFTANPLLISIFLTIPAIVGVTITPIVLFVSDHVWTRWGRRKPFVVIGGVPAIAALLLIPYANSLLVLGLLFIAYAVCNAGFQPFEPLTQEIVPASQRGRASIAHTLAIQVAVLSFFWILLGRYDDYYGNWPWSLIGGITGEKLSFYLMAIMSLALLLLTMMGIKEVEPPDRRSMGDVMGGRITLWRFFIRFFVNVFEKQYWPIYLLTFSQALYGVSLGGLGALMYTEQFGYTKQEMGNNIALGMAILLPITFATGFLVDKYNKLRIYQLSILGAVLTSVAYYLYVMVMLPDRRPSLLAMLVFGEIGAVIGQLSSTVSYPLLYDYVPRNKLGTAGAGLQLMRAGFAVLFGGLMGLWINQYSTFFMPHAGEQAMVVFQQPMTDPEVAAALDRAVAARAAEDLASGGVFRKAWFPPGVFGEASRVWLLRKADPEAERLLQQRDEWDQRRGELERRLDAAGNGGGSADNPDRQEVKQLKRRIAEADASVRSRADAFRRRLADGLGHLMVREGQQIQECRWSPSQNQLRLTVQTLALVQRWQLTEVVKELGARPGIDGVVVEAPGGLRVDGAALAEEDEPRHAPREAAEPGLTVTLSVSAPWPGAGVADDEAVRQRLRGLLMEDDAAAAALPTALSNALAVYHELVRIGRGNRMYVAEPFVSCEYAAQQYDYFSGYLLNILGGLAGLAVTVLIGRLEKKGVIQRLGAMEDQQTPVSPDPAAKEAVA